MSSYFKVARSGTEYGVREACNLVPNLVWKEVASPNSDSVNAA